MALKSLNQFLKLRNAVRGAKRLYYRHIWGMKIPDSTNFSLSARFDKTYPRGIEIGEYSYIAFDAAILTHDMTRGLYLKTTIGDNCFIGARSIILPGVTIGSGSLIASGAVVTKDVPPGSIVAGNPATVIRENVTLGRYGRFTTADATIKRLKAEGAFA